MKRFITLLFLFSIAYLSAQTVAFEEASDDELWSYLKVNANSFDSEQEAYFIESTTWGFEFVIYYDDKSLFRGDILKPRFQGSSSFTNHNFNTSRVIVDFLIPIDGLDKENALELRANDLLKSFKSNSGKNYVYPSGGWLLFRDNYKTKKLERFESLASKVSIKIFKTILKP